MYMPLYALFPFSYAVLADFFWVRVLREPRRGLRLRRPKVHHKYWLKESRHERVHSYRASQRADGMSNPGI